MVMVIIMIFAGDGGVSDDESDDDCRWWWWLLMMVKMIGYDGDGDVGSGIDVKYTKSFFIVNDFVAYLRSFSN